jgi:GTP-binding protein
MAEFTGGNHFVDFVRIHVKAGDGGEGCIAFMREKGKPFGGPCGGDGGRGGSIWLEADAEMTTLLDFKQRPSWVANRGQHGLGKNCSGRSGEDVVLKVPLGTTIIDAKTGEELGDLTRPGERFLAAKGGDGGRGNQHFATATNKAPRKAEAGWPGEERHLHLELKLIADVGFVGLPNAGKSTLLAALTNANPKIAPYPFTTLSPNLGVFIASDFQSRITLADIPGLIEGAHRGQGLGDRFLRHIERTTVLVHLVAPEGGTTGEGEISEANADPEDLLYSYRLVEAELEQYSALLLEKPRIVCLTKTDLITPGEVTAAVEAFRAEGIAVLPISCQSGDGIELLRGRIEKLVMDARAAEAAAREEEQERRRARSFGGDESAHQT